MGETRARHQAEPHLASPQGKDTHTVPTRRDGQRPAHLRGRAVLHGHEKDEADRKNGQVRGRRPRHQEKAGQPPGQPPQDSRVVQEVRLKYRGGGGGTPDNPYNKPVQVTES